MTAITRKMRPPAVAPIINPVLFSSSSDLTGVGLGVEVTVGVAVIMEVGIELVVELVVALVLSKNVEN